MEGGGQEFTVSAGDLADLVLIIKEGNTLKVCREGFSFS